MNPDSLASDLLGYAAAALVLITFMAQSMRALRTIAIASNLAFIAYAVMADLPPVLALHLVLLPLNAWRLWQASRTRREPEPQQRNEPSIVLPAPKLASFRAGGTPVMPGPRPRSEQLRAMLRRQGLENPMARGPSAPQVAVRPRGCRRADALQRGPS